MTNQTGYIVYATDSVGTAHGARIGSATQDIVPGEHVQLDNMRSDFDERASTLDAETALPEDVVYELY